MSFVESLENLVRRCDVESEALWTANTDDCENPEYLAAVDAVINRKPIDRSPDDQGIDRSSAWFPAELSSLCDLLSVLQPREGKSEFDTLLSDAIRAARTEPDVTDLRQKLDRLDAAHRALLAEWTKRAKSAPNRRQATSYDAFREVRESLRMLLPEIPDGPVPVTLQEIADRRIVSSAVKTIKNHLPKRTGTDDDFPRVIESESGKATVYDLSSFLAWYRSEFPADDSVPSDDDARRMLLSPKRD